MIGLFGTKMLVWIAVFVAFPGLLLAFWADKGVLKERTSRYCKGGPPTFAFLACWAIVMSYASAVTNEEKRQYLEHEQRRDRELAALGSAIIAADSAIFATDGLDAADGAVQRNGDGGALRRLASPDAATSPETRLLCPDDYAAGFALSRVGTNETFSFEAPSNAVWGVEWLSFGATCDWIPLAFPEGWTFPFGTNALDAAAVYSCGFVRKSRTSAGTFFAPLKADMDLLPAARHDLLPEPNRPSGFWSLPTPSNSLVMTWQNVALQGDTNSLASFQSEFMPNGDVAFRYDLSGASCECLSNVVVGVSNEGHGRVFTSIPSDVTSLRWARLDPATVDNPDPDGDGLATSDEIFVFFTDPYSADTDKDGLGDGDEVAAGTDPSAFDTDCDGLVDNIDPHPLSSDGDCYGQSAAWVSATFTNAAEILSMGYTNWIDAQIGTGLTNGLYKFTVTFTNTPPQATLLTVGDYDVIVTNVGEFVFLCKKGLEYEYRTQPACSFIEYSAVDDIPRESRGMLRSAAMWGSGCWSVDGGGLEVAGSVQEGAGRYIWLPFLAGYPDITHLGVEDMPQTFSANFSDLCSDVPVYCLWTTGNDRIQIADPTARQTSVSVDGMPNFDRFDLSVSADFGSWSLVSEIGLTFGTNDAPAVSAYVTTPQAVMFTGDGSGAVAGLKQPVVVGFSSDVPTNGTLRLESVSGADKIRLWRSLDMSEGFVSLPVDIQIDGETSDGSLTYYVEGTAVSVGTNDVVLRACFIDPGEASPLEGNCGASALTVVNPLHAVIPDAPATGLAVVLGDGVDFEVEYAPSGYDGESMSCDWFVGQRKGDGTYEEWAAVATGVAGASFSHETTSAGVFRLKAVVHIANDSKEVHYVHFSEPPHTLIKVGDEDHFGVSSTQTLLGMRNAAVGHIGDPRFSFFAELPSYYSYSAVPKGEWKCNAFVAYIATSAGVTVPVQHLTGLPWIGVGCQYPPLANEWAMGAAPIVGWKHDLIGANPEPGMIAGHPNPHGPGHCGIVDYDGMPIAAGREEVNKLYSKFFDGSTRYNRPTEDNE